MSSLLIYEGISNDKSVDFVITQVDDGYIVDVFNASIDDAVLAYLDTFQFDNLAEAKSDMTLYQHRAK